MLESRQERGLVVPALDNRPNLPQHLRWYLESFNLLSSRRGSGMNGALAITFSEIKAYLEVYPFFNNTLFIRFIVSLDIAFMNHHSNIQKQKSENKASPTQPVKK